MAPSFSNVKILSVFISEGFSNAILRRGFAGAAKTVSERSVSNGGTASAAMMKKRVEEAEKAPWVPDPKTGYYRPETVSEEIDPAELRAVLLNNKQ